MLITRWAASLWFLLPVAQAKQLTVTITEGPPLVYPRVCAAAIIDQGILRVAGGRLVGIGDFPIFENFSGDSSRFVVQGAAVNFEVNEIVRTTGGTPFFLGARPLHQQLQVPFTRSVTGSWIPTPHPLYRREWDTVTAISDNRVLVLGGKNGVRVSELSTSEWIYPLQGETASAPDFKDWKLTAPMKHGRALHQATFTQVDGEDAVLVTGGMAFDYRIHDSTEIYFPKRDVWEPSGNLLSARREHKATALPDGRIVIIGGEAGEYSVNRVEIFDPKTRQFSEVGNLKTSRRGHTTTLMMIEDRPILVVVGGYQVKPGNAGGTTSSIEIVDVERNQVYEVGNLKQARWNHFAVAQTKNQILIGGGTLCHGGFTSTEVVTLQLSE